MIRWVACALAVAGVAGCVSSQPAPHWSKPGASQEDFAAARYECLQKSAIQPTANQVTGRVETTNTDLYSACMGAKGWVWR